MLGDNMIKKIKEVCEVNPEQIPSNTHLRHKIAYIDIESVENGKIKGVKEFEFRHAPSRARRIVKEGDTIFSTVRPYLRAFAFIKHEHDKKICSTGFAVLRANENVSPAYLYQCMASNTIMKQTLPVMVGSNYPAINTSDLLEFKIYIPSLVEQQKIADILSVVDRKIELTEQLIAKYERIKEGTMQDLLTGRKRWKDEKWVEETEFQCTEAGEIPKEWEVKTIGDIGDLYSGTTPDRKKEDIFFVNGKTPWVKTLDLNNQYIFETEEKVTSQALKSTSLRMLPVGSVLVAMYGGFNQIGRTGILKIEATVNQAITAIVISCGIIKPEFLQVWLNLKVYLWRKFAASSRKDPNITKQDVLNFWVTIPSATEQEKIVGVLQSFEKKIRLKNKELIKYKMLKESLMQDLLTGKVRVPINELVNP